MQPAVMTAVVLPRAQDVNAVKRAEQLCWCPRAPQKAAPGISNFLAGKQATSQQQRCARLAQQQRPQTGADLTFTFLCCWPCRCQAVLYSMCTGICLTCRMRGWLRTRQTKS